MKYYLAIYIGHKILHDGDGQISSHASGGEVGGSPSLNQNKSERVKQKDILYAWRDFECSFFAGALLCPKTPLKRYLSANAYDIFSYKKLNVTPSVLMRRMTVVSPYKYWHYFDVYSPGYLRALYRGDRIRMPWGNMRIVNNPCNQWGVFKMLNQKGAAKPFPQISILKDKHDTYLNSSISIKVKDISNTPHVLCLGLNLEQALKKQIDNYDDFINDLESSIQKFGGKGMIPKAHAKEINKISRMLNIHWIEEALNNEIDITCTRNENCPREKKCKGRQKSKVSWIAEVKKEIIQSNK